MNYTSLIRQIKAVYRDTPISKNTYVYKTNDVTKVESCLYGHDSFLLYFKKQTEIEYNRSENYYKLFLNEDYKKSINNLLHRRTIFPQYITSKQITKYYYKIRYNSRNE